MKHRRKRGKTLLRCPSWGSEHVVYVAGLITGQKYQCLDCNYIGSFVLEEDLAEALDSDADPKKPGPG